MYKSRHKKRANDKAHSRVQFPTGTSLALLLFRNSLAWQMQLIIQSPPYVR